ncbi:MAG: agmatinase [Rickettsiales bacterium]|nr:agmatinase [Pseudomonadota bacterium]MDA0965917.1 agmatinase [Pseudomonadota bacterium]MDG4542613.1 agmatinase [Rickettsiales bacterium]MDG4545117.1 agmatinase [Rickettsiales bacterium]MDG4547240.1 agmatinase [Rickettsiales bacterium]
MKIIEPEQAFLGLEKEDAVSYENAKAVIIPFGLEASVSYGGGTSKGPQAMIDASHEVELFDEHLWCEPYRDIGIVTVEEPAIDKDLPKALGQLESLVQKVIDDGKFPFVFGGEHSITAGAIRPYVRKYDDLVILHFDAHADLRDGYDGEHYSHASALRRCLDDDKVKNKGEHLTLVSCGIRNISAGEIPFLEANRNRIHIYWAKDKRNWDIDEIISHVKGKNVYLTFDVDGFDGSLMPATGTPEPGGLFWEDALNIITKAASVSNIVGADINELAPIEGWHACDFLAAKLAYKILGLALCKKS